MRLPFLTAVLLFIVAAASGQQLGQTKEAIVARNGPAIEENHARNTAVYRSGPWKFDIVYADGIAKHLIVTKLDSLTEDEVRSILANNSDGAIWREIVLSGATSMWQRSDNATAQCDRIKPRSVLMTAPPRRDRSATATAVLPSTASKVSPQSSWKNRWSLATAKSAPFSRGIGFADWRTPLLAACLVLAVAAIALTVFFKFGVPFLLRRGTRIEVETARKETPSSGAPSAEPPPLPKKASPAIAFTLELAPGWDKGK